MLSVIVSLGAPVSRKASPRSPSAATARGSSFRVIVSGLYWNTTTLPSGFKGSTPIKAPLSNRGQLGNVLMAPCSEIGLELIESAFGQKSPHGCWKWLDVEPHVEPF